MVYCSRCGTQNPDTAVNCSNCGAPLYGANPPTEQYRHHYRRYDGEYYPRRGGAGIGLLIGGLIILAIGLALFYGQSDLIFRYFWPIVLVVLGIWLLIRGLTWSHRRSRQPQTA